MTLRKKRAPNGEPLNYYLNTVLTYTGNECLIWPYSKDRGYAIITLDGKTYRVQRMVCEHVNGPPSPNQDSRHTCGKGTDGCVSPNHLIWGTRKENIHDQIEHGTFVRGEKSGMAKLTQQDVAAILSDPAPQKIIAQKFGIHQTTVSKIKLGRLWKY